MIYYIAESSKNSLFTTTLIARCETQEEAAEFCKKAVAEWREEGLETITTIGDDNMIWGAQAMTPWHFDGREETCEVVHLYHVFATPIFMAGGEMG